jgi:VanZ family protein
MSSFFNRHRTALRWLPALCCAMIIFTFSAIPGDEIGQSYERLEGTLQTISAPQAAKPLLPAIPAILKLDWLKLGHVVGYFWLGVAMLYAMPADSRLSPSIALLLCMLYGVSDELHQCFVPGRSASPRDILIDTLAALGGVMVMLGVMALGAWFKGRRGTGG